jgi:E3 ubiquitin-protein ligase ATL4
MNSTNMEAGTPLPPAPIPVVNNHSSETAGSKGASVSPSVFIISAVVLVAIISIFFIQRLIRYFCHHSHSSSYQLPIYRTFSFGNTANAPTLSGHEIQKLIDSLPTFTLGTSMAKLPKSSLDCAVCCEPFSPDALLRLLPACCHAFHKPCVDTWLKSNPSCPLCRSSITLPHPALPESIRLELGSISSRRSEPSGQIQNQIRPTPPASRTYSLESHDYCIEEEIEIVPPRATRSLEKRGSDMSDLASPPPPQPRPPPPSEPPPPPLPSAPQHPPPPIGTLTREEPAREWLTEFLDRLSSASSSFNSMRFPSQRRSDRWSGRWSGRWSQRSSQRFDSGVGRGQPPDPDTWLWDLEAGRNEETGDAVALYRWLVGV